MNIHNPASLPSFFAPPPQIKTNISFMLKTAQIPKDLCLHMCYLTNHT